MWEMEWGAWLAPPMGAQPQLDAAQLLPWCAACGAPEAAALRRPRCLPCRCSPRRRFMGFSTRADPANTLTCVVASSEAGYTTYVGDSSAGALDSAANYLATGDFTYGWTNAHCADEQPAICRCAACAGSSAPGWELCRAGGCAGRWLQGVSMQPRRDLEPPAACRRLPVGAECITGSGSAPLPSPSPSDPGTGPSDTPTAPSVEGMPPDSPTEGAPRQAGCCTCPWVTAAPLPVRQARQHIRCQGGFRHGCPPSPRSRRAPCALALALAQAVSITHPGATYQGARQQPTTSPATHQPQRT